MQNSVEPVIKVLDRRRKVKMTPKGKSSQNIKQILGKRMCPNMCKFNAGVTKECGNVKICIDVPRISKVKENRHSQSGIVTLFPFG